jgi:hypothetical protein
MEPSFDPVNQLTTLLGPKPNHPWGALIPQVLLWSFRRFCIIKLTQSYDTPLTDQLWDDHLELIHLYAPKGLESATTSWLTPENVEHVHSSLEEYNRFFLDCLDAIDKALKESDAVMEDVISGFLDHTIKDVIHAWLDGENAPFLIFPLKDENDDEFTDAQFTALLECLMAFGSSVEGPYQEVEEPVEEIVTQLVEELVENLLEEIVVEPLKELVVEPVVEPVQEPVQEPAPVTIKEAIRRRKTHRILRICRVKTRRIHT